MLSRSALLQALSISLDRAVSVHVAIFSEPFLSFVLTGEKTKESRFSIHRVAPFERVHPDDLLCIKRPAGPIVAYTFINEVESLVLTKEVWSRLKTHESNALCIKEESFWQEKSRARYATLLSIGGVQPVEPILFPKRDRRGWVVLE